MCIACGSATHAPASRRRFLLAGAGLALAATSMSALVGRVSAQDAPTPPPNAMSGEAALKRLMDGNARYAANQPQQKDFSAGRAARAQAQYPFAAIVSCSDSRVAPEYAFDEGPGELFVVRVAGNFINDDGLASLEFGTQFLGAPLILVLGHSSCGAISGAIGVMKEGLQLPGRLPELVASIKPAVEAAKASGAKDLLAAATVENVKLAVERLKTGSPVLSDRISQGKLALAGGVYELSTGKVTLV
jgi:carbonic anhydrase